MRYLANLLGQNLCYIGGDRESGPNGAKRAFLNRGKVFLRALGKDLGLHDVKVLSNAAGIGVSGECYLYGMWEQNGIHICLQQMTGGVLLYRSIRNLNDYKGGYNQYLTRMDLQTLSYEELLSKLSMIRKEGCCYGIAA